MMEPISQIQSTSLSEPENYQQKMLEAWQKFITNQELQPIVPPLIASSWYRSWGRVNPNNKLEFTRMGSEYMLGLSNSQF